MKVYLSGGPEGGASVDGSGWDVGSIMAFNGSNYRYDGSGVAVYVGPAPE